MNLNGFPLGVQPRIYESVSDGVICRLVPHDVRWHVEHAPTAVSRSGIRSTSDVELQMCLNQLSEQGWTILTVLADGTIVAYCYKPEAETVNPESE